MADNDEILEEVENMIPTTRVELYLAKLCGFEVDIPEEPLSRVEYYLDKINESGINNGSINADYPYGVPTYKINITTSDTGGNTASMLLKLYENDNLLEQINVVYNTVNSETSFFNGLIKLQYNNGWKLIANKITYYTTENKISINKPGAIIETWNYTTVVDYDVEVVSE